MRRSIIHLIVAVALILSSRVQAGKQASKSPESPRVFSLAIEPSAIDSQKSYSLVPKAEELTEGDAAVLYNKAVQALPAKMNVNQLADWRKVPLSQLPKDQIQAVLQQAQSSLDLVSQGAKCKNGNWPPFVPGTMPANLSEYRQLTFLLCLKARLEIAQGQYDKAIETLRTGLTMSKHIGEAPTIIQGMTGIAVAALMLRPVEDLAQVKGSPNLYPALHTLPRPLINIEVPISSELKNLESSKQYNALTRGLLRDQLEESHKRVRVTANRLDGDVAALQCVEALRHYAASHNGQLPKQLGEVSEVQVPQDPLSGKPFAYRYDGSKAVLEVSVPKGGTPRDGTRYEMTVAR
ncbi:MAG: hypothetical protein NTZ17_18165 [Phycisphaerae bacterium]|nr:hypothetical protein [Phycisphaerae bacterium]